jgi:hypothetical protein
LINGLSALLAALSFDVGVPGANRRRDGHPASRSRFR